MIAEIGHFALVLALSLALLQSLFGFWGAATGQTSLMRAGRTASLAQAALTALAFAILIICFARSDFSVLSVAANSHTSKPMLYKIGAAWGHHEGSLLLWVTVLAGFGAAVALFGHNLPAAFRARVLSIQGLTGAGFLTFLLLTSNPFWRLDPAPANGDGFNPLLQDPALLIHPPLLYLGYVGFSVPFAFAIAALLNRPGTLDWSVWARWVRPWALASWSLLTVGIGLGSWWAYYELGWGGWWFWDPVENASFMPWLLGTALIHSAIVTEKRDALKSWTCLLAILAFGLSLLGTFLVRSGVLNSVHSFANDPARGIFVLGLMALIIGGALLLYALRAPGLASGSAPGSFRPISREGALLLNNLVLATACATVMLGTLYPLIAEALNWGAVSVGPPYYAQTFVPLMLPLVAAMGIGALLPWKRGDLAALMPRAAAPAVIALLVTLWAVDATGDWGSLAGFAAGTFLFLLTMTDLYRRLFKPRRTSGPTSSGPPPSGRVRRLPPGMAGMILAHLGFAVTVLAIAGASAWKQETRLALRPGETAQTGPVRVTFSGMESLDRGDHTAERATLTVQWHGEAARTYHPEYRIYRTGGEATTEAAIQSDGLIDRHAVLGEPDANGVWTVRLYRQPLVPFLWIGALMMALGGGVSLLDRRLRLGLPVSRTTSTSRSPARQGSPA